jgi:hypothetical protein
VTPQTANRRTGPIKGTSVAADDRYVTWWMWLLAGWYGLALVAGVMLGGFWTVDRRRARSVTPTPSADPTHADPDHAEPVTAVAA